MKNKRIYYITIIIFFLTISLPLFQTFFDILPEPSLIGFTEEIVTPSFNFTDWFNGSFQASIKNWYDQDLGLKSYLVKTDNEINYLLFNEIHQKTSSKIIIGKEDYLYEDNYIKSYIGRDYKDTKILEERIKNLKIIQDLLRERKIAFVFLIAPSKASFYPEYIPPELIYKTIDPDPATNYNRIIPILDKENINYIDGRDFLLNKKYSSQYPLFSKSGTHWTRYGSCLMTNEIMKEASNQLHEELILINCDDVMISPEPKFEDRDLADLANLWSDNSFLQELAYPKKSVSEEFLNDVSLLQIGDSFSWGILNNLKKGKIVKDYNFYYYFNSDYDYQDNVFDINKNLEVLRESILEKQIVVIEANEASLKDVGFGFIDAGIEALKADKEFINY